jgi:hypothetical protein
MGKPLATYDPAQVFVTAAGTTLNQGIAKGSFVTVERNSDAFTTYIGSDGEGARSKSNDKSGTIKLKLMHTSDANDILSAFAKADEIANAGSFPMLIKDGTGRTLCMAENAWVKKMPSIEFGNEIGEREWTIESDNINIFVGGTD